MRAYLALALAGVCLMASGCGPKQFRETATVVKITGGQPNLSDSSGAFTGNRSVQIDQQVVYTVRAPKTELHPFWTIAIVDGEKVTAAEVESRICVGTQINIPIVDNDETAAEADVDPNTYGGTYSADDVIVSSPCLNNR